MAQPSAVDILPRHLQGTASASSSSNASPAGTPPNPPSVGTSSGHARSPSASQNPLPSPGGNAAPSNAPPGSPSTSNRFGLNLGFIQRRPRGWTTSSAQRSPGGRGSPAASPSTELPPSPGGSERTGGYGFPALRRTLSKRASSHGGENARPRARRSSSQPPEPHALVAGGSAIDSRPASGASAGASSSTGDAQQAAQPSFSALTASTSLPNPPDRPVSAAPSRSATGDSATSGTTHKLRLVPHLESSRSLHFDPIERDLAASAIVRVGRFTDRHNSSANSQIGTATDPARVAFKSKVVSRGHAEIWVDDAGKFYIRDTKSSSGTFLNHIRLSAPNVESRPFSLKDGDVLQLGVDYQGGTEEIYRCVKMRVELNRGWQRGANSFNTAALAQLRALGGGGSTPMDLTPTAGSAMTAAPSASSAATPVSSKLAKTPSAEPAASITDCCICLYPVTVCQALFIAPCSHVTHFKCIRPLVEQNYPGFCCPLCRTYANLEADVEIDLPEPEPVADEPLSESALGLSGVSREPDLGDVEEVDEPTSRAPSIRAPRPSGSRRSSVAALTNALNEAARRASSRPASIAPSVRENGAGEVAEEAEEGEENSTAENEDVTSSLPPMAPPVPAVSASSASPDSSPTPLPIGISSSSSSHLAPPSDDLYASLANAATPPNNTFLSTLAESGVAPSAFFARAAATAGRPNAAGPPASGAAGMGSLDAALLAQAGAGPSRTSLSQGTATSASDGEADDGDAETQEAGSARGDDDALESPALSASSGSGSATGAGAGAKDTKGKGKQRQIEDVGAAAAAAAAVDGGASAAVAKGQKGKTPEEDQHHHPAMASALLF
ncbi:hypothetical protein JCM10207_004877 [Rhodosporidiobolus poonsookiae]